MFGAYKFAQLVKFPGLNVGINVLDPPQELPKEVLPVGVQTTTPTVPPAEGAYMLPMQIDAKGALWTHIVAGLGPVSGQIPSDGMVAPTAPIDSTSYLMVFNGASWDRVRSWSDTTATIPLNAIGSPKSIATMWAYSPFDNGWIRATADYDSVDGRLSVGPGMISITHSALYNGATWDRVRLPAIFKTVTATAAGSTAVWTPTAGKKFRLMGYSITLTGNAVQGVAGNFEMVFLDAAAAVGAGHSEYVPGIALNTFGASGTGKIDFGNGILSALANNVLNINLSAALTGGECRVNVWGTEE